MLSPTRELASQIAGNIRTYGRGTGLRTALLYGGVPKQAQTRTLANGIDIVVAHAPDGCWTISATAPSAFSPPASSSSTRPTTC